MFLDIVNYQQYTILYNNEMIKVECEEFQIFQRFFKTADIQISFSASLVGVETRYMCPWRTKPVISSTAIFIIQCMGSKLLIFIVCQKSLDIKIMFHEDILHCKYI